MRSGLWALQKAIFSTLTNDAELMGVINGVYDDFAPTNTTLPFITLGDDTVNDYSTKTFDGEEITHTMHIWSDYEGKKEAKEIIDLTLQALTKQSMVLDPPFSLDSIQREFLEVVEDETGIYHGIVRFRFKIKQIN